MKLTTLTTLTKKAVEYGIVALSFIMWDQKRKIRDVVKYGSLGLISVSTVLLIVEVIAELFGGPKIAAFIRQYGVYSLTGFAVASVFLIFHHYEEAKKPEFEYAFVLRMWEFMESRRHTGGSQLPVKDALGIFYRIFERASVRHVSIYRLREDGCTLSIDPAEVYPLPEDPSFYVKLSTGVGVAGHVYQDMKARYMPRMTLFRRPFPHAINFEWTTPAGHGGTHPIDLSDLDFDFNVYKPAAPGSEKYESLLSVPLKSVRKGQTVGVLNLDFIKRDPLDKKDVAMAMVIGLILADEI